MSMMNKNIRFFAILFVSGSFWFMLLFLFHVMFWQVAPLEVQDSDFIDFLIKPFQFFILTTLLPGGLLILTRHSKDSILRSIASGAFFGGLVFFIVYVYIDGSLFNNLI